MTRLQYASAPIAICEAARSLPNPPTGDGADVSDWTAAARGSEQYGQALQYVELTILAGADVSFADGAMLVAEEVHNTFPEESAAITTTHGTDTVNYTGHGFYTGDGPVRLTGTLPAELDDETEYYVIRTGSGTLKLAASRALALAGTAVAFGSDASASPKIHWVTGTKSTSQNASAIDATANTYTIAGHGIATGTRVQVANSGGAIPTSLAANTDYYAIAVDDDTLAFSLTVGGAAINWSGGSGTQSVVSDERGPTEETVYVMFAELNEGFALDLTADIAYREKFEHRPDVVAYHLVATLDAFVPITSYVRGLREVER